MMTKQTRRLAMAGALLTLLLCLAPAAGAGTTYVPYQSYTYGWSEWYQWSPDAYTPALQYNTKNMGLPAPGEGIPADLKEASDIFVAPGGDVFIADTGNDRVVILSKDLEYKSVITQFMDYEALTLEYVEAYMNKEGNEYLQETYDEGIDEFSGLPWKELYPDVIKYYEEELMMWDKDNPIAGIIQKPEGVFVTEDTVYVANTASRQVVALPLEECYPEDGMTIVPEAKKVVRESEVKKSDILARDFTFEPVNIVVDSAGRLYVNVKYVNQGIMEFSVDGAFVGFYGAQKVRTSPLSWFFTVFMTEEQRARQITYVPRVYNNIAIDGDDFVWLTANSMEEDDIISHWEAKDSEKAPIKRMNPAGEDVLKRTGFLAPAGDYDIFGVSSIIDVAPRDHDIYTLLDTTRNKLFTYDRAGNLMYAFGGTGTQLGVFEQAAAIVYQGEDLLVLDKAKGTVTRFARTDYARLIDRAIDADENSQFEESAKTWGEVHKRNANLDLAYVGMAKSFERNHQYQEAMHYYKMAHNNEGYSQAFREYRSLYVKDNVWWIILIPIGFIAAWLLFGKYTKKVNNALFVTGSKTTLKQEVLYAWRCIYHPINGFWELKRSKRGSMRAATIFMVATIFTFFLRATGTAYIFNDRSIQYVSLFRESLNVIIPIILWCLASWALTTLFSGEGSMKDIYIALGYALLPLILLNIPVTMVSHVLSLEEKAFMDFFIILSYIWAVGLIVVGSMATQDYTFSKNLLTVIFSVVGMGAILFLVLLLLTLTQKIGAFFGSLYEEIIFRLR